MLVFPSRQSVHMYNTQVDQIIYSADPTTTNSLLVDYPSSVYTPVNEECLFGHFNCAPVPRCNQGLL